MAWDQRANGRRYYYCSVRDGDRVKRVYLGSGARADAVAARFDKKDAEQKAQRAAAAAQEARIAAAMASLEELNTVAEAVVHAAFVEAGYHKTSGKWRRHHATDG
ncbi:MAG: hypothetical protein WCL32_22060 [Planctomycetota bacterium]